MRYLWARSRPGSLTLEQFLGSMPAPRPPCCSADESDQCQVEQWGLERPEKSTAGPPGARPDASGDALEPVQVRNAAFPLTARSCVRPSPPREPSWVSSDAS
ncbi:hypothetical protein CB1_000273034 [Camelus ferus]|nr:hypothetical protein CB1_000273034 [Camelus ferus]